VTTQRISDGRQLAISADGRFVAYHAPDTPGFFLRDRQTGTSERVSAGSKDWPPGAINDFPLGISDDARFVVFTSPDAESVSSPGPANVDQVYLRDRQAGTTERISVNDSGDAGNAASDRPSVTPDGRYVVFESEASNLVVGDSNDGDDVFVRDRTLNTTTRVSVAADGSQASGPGYVGNHYRPAVSDDGRYVAFSSFASNLVAGDTNQDYDVFRRDRVAGTTVRVSIGTNGAQTDGAGVFAMSRDGDRVAFMARDVFEAVLVRDIASGTTKGAVKQRDGTSTFYFTSPTISGDGRYIGFISDDPNLVPGDTNGDEDVFVYDMTTATTTRASVTADGTENRDNSVSASSTPSLSRDGGWIAFATDQPLAADDGPNDQDIYVRNLAAPTVVVPSDPLVLRPGAPTALAVDGSHFDPDMTVSAGAGVAVTGGPTASPTHLDAQLTADSAASEGPRDIVLTNPDGCSVVLRQGAEVRRTDGEFHPLTPARILDTRDGTGGVSGKVAAQSPVPVPIAGRGGVPLSGASAVVMNVTATQGTVASYLTVYPTGQPAPVASNVNFSSNQDVPNLITVKLGPDGKVNLFNNAGAVHVIFDVAGWYGTADADPGTRFHAVSPERHLDTREDYPLDGTADLTIAGEGSVPPDASAVVMNVTAVDPSDRGFIAVFPSDSQQATTSSNLNFDPGQTVPNLVVVPLSADGSVRFATSVEVVDVVADVVGWFDAGDITDGRRFQPLSPARILDTRSGNGGVGKVQGQSPVAVQIAGRGGVPASGATAVVMNVTVTQGTQESYLTVYPSGQSPPLASNLNFLENQDIPNLVTVKLGPDGKVNVFNNNGAVHVIFDVVGWY